MANVWHNLGDDNRWDGADGAWFYYDVSEPNTWAAGKITVNIPVYWTIGAPEKRDVQLEEVFERHYMTTWEQSHEVDTAGNFTTKKFDIWVKRSLAGVYETSEPPSP